MMQLLTSPIVALVLGDGGTEAVSLARIVLLSTVPYAVYLLLRNLLDALEVKALNTGNLLVALGGMLLIVGVSATAHGVGWGLAMGLTILGALTALRVRGRL